MFYKSSAIILLSVYGGMKVKKVKQQIMINSIIIVFSALCIFITYSLKMRRIVSVGEWGKADLVLVMINSLLTTGAWKKIEDIHAPVYDFVWGLILVLYAGLYTIAVVDIELQGMEFIIWGSMAVFVILYVVDNIIITEKKKKEVIEERVIYSY